MKPVRLAILISGRGSNMQAILAASSSDPHFAAIPVLVISDRPDAKGLKIAAGQGVAICVKDHSQRDFENDLHNTLTEHEVELVALAGFMRILGNSFVRRWSGRLLNIHPSLLPEYKGLHTHERALQDQRQWHGCSVHLVSEQLDAGTLLAQARLQIQPEDSPKSLADRVLALEHQLYPDCIAGIARQIRRHEARR